MERMFSSVVAGAKLASATQSNTCRGLRLHNAGSLRKESSSVLVKPMLERTESHTAREKVLLAVDPTGVVGAELELFAVDKSMCALEVVF